MNPSLNKAPSLPVLTNSPLGTYEILETIGEGSFGVVHQCRSRKDGNLYAIKKFREGDDVKNIAVREIKMLKIVNGHPNIIKLHEVYKRKGRLYMVMDYVEFTVMDLLEGKHLPPSQQRLDGELQGLGIKRSRRIMSQILAGLEYVHKLQMIHRDIKPENILCSSDGSVVKLCDFGLSRKSARAPLDLMKPSGPAFTDYVATRWYRSPELLLGALSYDVTVDIWAIACLWVEILSGKPLFPGSGELEMLTLLMECMGDLPSQFKTMFCKSPSYKGMTLPGVRVIGWRKKLAESFDIRDENADMVMRCCQWMPSGRLSATDLLIHPFLGQYSRKVATSRTATPARLGSKNSFIDLKGFSPISPASSLKLHSSKNSSPINFLSSQIERNMKLNDQRVLINTLNLSPGRLSLPPI